MRWASWRRTLTHLSAPDQALWAAVGMGAMLSGSLGVPLTAILFCLEITHCLPALLPVMLGCVAAYAMTSLIMPRSILTEKISRRGYHLTREYGTDPLETVSLVEVMSELGPQDCAERPPDTPLPEVYAFTDETSRAVVEKMAMSGLTQLLVIDRATNLDLWDGKPPGPAARPPQAGKARTGARARVRCGPLTCLYGFALPGGSTASGAVTS